MLSTTVDKKTSQGKEIEAEQMNEMPSTMCDSGLWSTVGKSFYSPLVETTMISGLTWWYVFFYPFCLSPPTHEVITENFSLTNKAQYGAVGSSKCKLPSSVLTQEHDFFFF